MDIVIAAVLVGFAVYGARRGLFRSLAGLVIVVVALVGASLVANVLSDPAASMLSPLVEQRIETRVDQVLADWSDTVQMPEAEVEDDGLSPERLLALLGIDDTLIGDLAERAQERIRETGVDIAMAVVKSLADSFIHTLLFILAFFILLIALKLLARAMDQVLKLPGLHFFNGAGGAVFGLAEGVVLVLLALWLAQHFGVSVARLTEGSVLVQLYTTHAPGAVSLLQ